jgi:hypothetical protein
MVFVLFVFLMASSVLLAGFQTRLQLRAIDVFASAERSDIPMIWASVGIEAGYGAVLILIGLWFGLRAEKQKQWVLFLTSIMLMCFGATGSHLCVSLIAVNNAANAWLWYWPVYGLRTLGMIALGWLTVVFPTGRFVVSWSRWLVVLWTTTCLVLLLFPSLPFNFVYGTQRPWLLDSSAATLLSTDSIWRKLGHSNLYRVGFCGDLFCCTAFSFRSCGNRCGASADSMVLVGLEFLQCWYVDLLWLSGNRLVFTTRIWK